MCLAEAQWKSRFIKGTLLSRGIPDIRLPEKLLSNLFRIIALLAPISMVPRTAWAPNAGLSAEPDEELMSEILRLTLSSIVLFLPIRGAIPSPAFIAPCLIAPKMPLLEAARELDSIGILRLMPKDVSPPLSAMTSGAVRTLPPPPSVSVANNMF